MKRVSLVFALLAAGGVLAARASATDILIPGKSGMIKSGKLVKWLSKGTFPLPAAGGPSDPAANGAMLRFLDTDPTAADAGDVTFTLPGGAQWKMLGNPPGSKGYKYKGAGTPADPCKVVMIKSTKIKAVCTSDPFPLSTPVLDGDLGIALLVGTGMQYCAEFGGTEIKDNDTVFKHKDAGPPDGCSASLLPLVIGSHQCTFAPGSQLALDGLPFPLAPFSADGAMDITCGAVALDGKASCDCTLQSLDPIDLIAVGYVCFAPGTACPAGEIDCDGGNALDVTVDSDHNIGTCTGNPDCATQCGAYCAPDSVSNSGCEGFCIGGANDGLPCTADSLCPGGSCPGKDGVAQHTNVCQCDCLGVGGAPSAAGGLQCNLPVDITVETAGPCDGTDVLIAIGTRCIPLTTETVTAQIYNKETTPGFDYPAIPHTANGTAIDCTTLAGSTTTGLEMVGSLTFFDSTVGDYLMYETLVCE